MKQHFLIVVAGLLLTAGCATNFSAPGVHAEIVRQTGVAPVEAFELNVGRLTMALARHMLGDSPSSKDALLGSDVTAFEIAVYDLAPNASPEAPVLDFTRIPVRGWEPTLRFRSGHQSGMLLVRTSGGSVGDLVILASDQDSAIYGRLSGTLSKELQAVLAEAIRNGGTHGVRHELESLSQEK